MFSSWVNESTRHMWARDSFPLQCINLGVRGRFSMLGYDAKVLDGKSKHLQSAAEEILNHVRVDRPRVSLPNVLTNSNTNRPWLLSTVHVQYSLYAIVLGA